MRIILENFNKNIQSFARDCGYRPLSMSQTGEMNCVRSLQGRDYPRFHIYIKKEGHSLIVNLHLDQKKPSYEGQRAHGGDYDSEFVEEEANRIKNISSRI